MAEVNIKGNIAKIVAIKNNRVLISVAENEEYTDKVTGEVIKNTIWYSVIVNCKLSSVPYNKGDLIAVSGLLHPTIGYSEDSRAYLNLYVNTKLKNINLIYRNKKESNDETK